MARYCKVCRHPEREAIELAIIDKDIIYDDIAAQYGMSVASISRHNTDGHITERVAKAVEAKEVACGNTLLERLEKLEADARRIGETAESNDRLSTALQANREQQRIIELLLKVAGELKNEQNINITVSQDWIKLREIILTCLAPYPEARHAVLTGLKIYQETGKVVEPNELGEIVDGEVRRLPNG